MLEPHLLGLLWEERPAKLKARSGEGKDAEQALFRSQDRSQAQCVFCPLPQYTHSENDPGRTEQGWLQNWGGGYLTSNPKPPSCSMPKSFPLSEMGVSGCWMHGGGAPRSLSWGVEPSPGMPQVTSSSSGTYICPKVWVRGRTGQPYTWAPHAYFVEETQNPRDSCTV